MVLSTLMDPGTISTLAGSWNSFRKVGDILHLVGTFLLIAMIVKNQHCHGISWKAQLMYTLVFITRYLDLPDNMDKYGYHHDWHIMYLILFKLTYISCQLVIMFLFWKTNQTAKGGAGSYEQHKDTCPIAIFLVPCIVLAVLTSELFTMKEILWTFSEYLEGFAMVPQYLFIYRHNMKEIKKERSLGVDYYIFCIGGYRTLYACNWIYKYYISEKVMIHSTIGGVIEIAFFGDFLMYAITGASFLRTAILGLDDKLNDVSDQIELKVFPNRADEVEQNRLRRRNMGDQEYRQVRTQSENEYTLGEQVPIGAKSGGQNLDQFTDVL